MSKLSRSPERHTFQKNGYIERCRKEGKDPDPSIIKMYESWAEENSQYEHRPENDLEYDLRTTEWILEKARSRDEYAQNIYAALSNMRWQKLDVFPILKDEYWSCSWRSAGGVVADMLQQGDYIDWYCSGMGGLDGDYDPAGGETFEQWQARTKYVPEGQVTEEIRADFQKLGWVPSEWPDED
jgi:hypothetical protein